MTEQMDNVEFLREQEASYRRCNTPGEANAFARCAEEIESARKAKPVPADVSGLVKRLRAYSSADHRASVCDEAARFLESMTPPVDGAANTIPVPQTTLEWIEKKCADKRNPAVSFVCRKLLDGEALSPLRDEQSAPTPAPQEPCRAMPRIEPALHRPGCEHEAQDDAALREILACELECYGNSVEGQHIREFLPVTKPWAMAALSAMRRVQAPSPAGEGYVVVPSHLTPELFDGFTSVNCSRGIGGMEEFVYFSGDFGNFATCYDAMLAARPPIPTASSAGVTVTDEMVTAACVAFWSYGGGFWVPGMEKGPHVDHAVIRNFLAMRSAILSALSPNPPANGGEK